jgi:hypothetical protein
LALFPLERMKLVLLSASPRRCRHANDRIDAAFLRSRLQRPSTQLEQPIAASDSPLPKALGAAILESQTEGIQGMSAKTADLRRR